ncbi:WhiB family transcriptional regulator [Streptomyces anulatus]|uniref:WhiB family transcriptional regulator n=1 Tax=Streptomyces TaxID=1883 RepID=UPI0015CF1F85|nr:WhiB family transcriptional regulator [Streptomyces sp. or20]
MTVLNASTRRPTTWAAPPPDWKVRSVCRGSKAVKADDFFSTSQSGQARAHAACLGCPVIVECLQATQDLDSGTYRWGIGGGLEGSQRYALESEALLGNRPNLGMARVLVSPRWLLRLRDLRRVCGSLEGMTVALHGDGLMVDEVTVRVAVWWSGADAPRMAWRTPEGERSLRARLRGEYLPAISYLKGQGVPCLGIAAYLGVPGQAGARAVTEALRAAAQKQPEVAA